jgi:chromosome segregation ATPase
MKTFNVKHVAAMLIVAAWCTLACNNSSEKKVESAREDVNDAKQDLQKAQNNYNEEWQKFHDDARIRIDENNNRIAEYRVKIKTEKQDVRDRDEKRIAELETRNHNLQVKLDSYKDDGNSNWDSFKREFNHDMDELGHAIGDIFKNNER